MINHLRSDSMRDIYFVVGWSFKGLDWAQRSSWIPEDPAQADAAHNRKTWTTTLNWIVVLSLSTNVWLRKCRRSLRQIFEMPKASNLGDITDFIEVELSLVPVSVTPMLHNSLRECENGGYVCLECWVVWRISLSTPVTASRILCSKTSIAPWIVSGTFFNSKGLVLKPLSTRRRESGINCNLPERAQISKFRYSRPMGKLPLHCKTSPYIRPLMVLDINPRS